MKASAVSRELDGPAISGSSFSRLSTRPDESHDVQALLSKQCPDILSVYTLLSSTIVIGKLWVKAFVLIDTFLNATSAEDTFFDTLQMDTSIMTYY